MLEEIVTNQSQRFVGKVITVTLAGKRWWQVGETQVNPSYVVSRTPWYPLPVCKHCGEEPNANAVPKDDTAKTFV